MAWSRRLGNVMAARRILAMVIAAHTAGCATAATKNGEPEGDAAPPAYRKLRYDEEYSYLADASKRGAADDSGPFTGRARAAPRSGRAPRA